MTLKTSDFQSAAKWAHDLTQKEFCVLDTETTGLDAGAQICQIAAIDQDGSCLFNSLVKPTIAIPAAASQIHGITDDLVANAPTMLNVLLPLLQAIGSRDVAIYNAEYDLKLLRQSMKPYGIPLAFPTSDRRGCRIWISGASIHCIMMQFSAFCGEWNDYFGNYKWQKLPGGDHSALGDCRAALAVIRRMAASYQPVDPVEENLSFG